LNTKLVNGFSGVVIQYEMVQGHVDNRVKTKQTIDQPEVSLPFVTSEQKYTIDYITECVF